MSILIDLITSSKMQTCCCLHHQIVRHEGQAKQEIHHWHGFPTHWESLYDKDHRSYEYTADRE